MNIQKMLLTIITSSFLFLNVFDCFAQKKKKKKSKSEEPISITQKQVDSYNEFGCDRFGEDKEKTMVEASLYTEFYKQKDYDSALPHWRYVFENAPGLRQNTFIRGENMYKIFIEEETDKTKKEELISTLFEIIEKRGDCWGQKGSALARKAFYIASYYKDRDQEVFDLFDRAIDLDGNNADPEIFYPYLSMLFAKVNSKEVSREKFDVVFDQTIEVCTYNIENSTEQASNFEQLQKKLNKLLGKVQYIDDRTVRGSIKDCASCKAYYQPKLQADPENLDIIKSYYGTLAKFDCKKDPEYFRMILKRVAIDPNVPRSLIYMAGNIRYKEKDYNAAKKHYKRAIDLYDNEPEVLGKIQYLLASMAYSEQNYEEARTYYRKAQTNITDNEKKAKVMLKLAEITYRNDKDYSAARKLAEAAADQQPDWGAPYILIGQLYASGAKNCGNDWDKQTVYWCAVDAWKKAQRIDNSFSEKAQKNINKYTQYFPTKKEAFMRGYTEGNPYDVACWIQRKTTVRVR